MLHTLPQKITAWAVLIAVFSVAASDCISATCAKCCATGPASAFDVATTALAEPVAHVGCRAGCDVCCPTIEEVTEEQSCWNVKCERVCVPAFRLPWQPGGSKLTLFNWLEKRESGRCSMACSDSANHNGPGDASGGCHCSRPPCGAVRCVRVLEEETVEITMSKCKWEIRPLPGCCTDCRSDSSSESPAAAMPEDEPNGALPPPPE